ncbi:MAG: hypothetical protein ABSG96_12075 [Terracidiphilus sp.]|jgi:hypothetical protein
MTRRKPRSEPDAAREECIEFSNGTSLHVAEQGVGATFLNPRRKQLRKVRYDGCYNRPAGRGQADYIVGFHGMVDVIVELKGSDLKRALVQIEDTLGAWEQELIRFPQIVCLIVFGHTFPRMNSRLGFIEREFLLAHRTLLWLRESGTEKFKFSKLQGKGR